ncbi:tetratricopeptide repeat protein [bacterium]|jgi:tetratricopeptide (TPR) repeat protein|nr:tetratricopeptide repeat protein [bacterium]
MSRRRPMNLIAFGWFVCLSVASSVLAEENDPEWREFMALGDQSFSHSQYKMAEENFLEAHRLAKDFPERDLRRAYTAVRIADVYARDDRRAKARDLYEKAIDVFTEAQDDGLEHLAYTLKQLADLDSFEGKLSTAIDRYRRSKRILTVLEQHESDNFTACQFGIARAERLAGQLTEAEKDFHDILARLKDSQKSPVNTGEILAEYANIPWQKGDLPKTDQLLQEAYRQACAKRGEMHREVADILVRRSQLLAQMHRFDESKKLAERSQFIYRETH